MKDINKNHPENIFDTEKEEEGTGRMRDKICLAIIGFLIGAIIAFVAREYRLRQASDFDIKYEHFKMREQQEYLYCPYCGEYIGEEEDADNCTTR